MQYMLRVHFVDGKDLAIVLEKKGINSFIGCISNNEPYWTKENNSCIGIPVNCIKYYQCFEYTREMQKLDEDKRKETELKAEKSKQEVKE